MLILFLKKVQCFFNYVFLKEVVVYLKKVLNMNEDFDKVRYDLGLMYCYLGENKEVFKCFLRIIFVRWGKLLEYKVIIINVYE